MNVLQVFLAFAFLYSHVAADCCVGVALQGVVCTGTSYEDNTFFTYSCAGAETFIVSVCEACGMI